MNELLSVVLTIITAATPLLLAAIGELVVERSGVLNLGVEGMMVVGAVCGFGAALMTGSPLLGIAGGDCRRRGAVAAFRLSHPDHGLEPGGDGSGADAAGARPLGPDRRKPSSASRASSWSRSTFRGLTEFPSSDPFSSARIHLVYVSLIIVAAVSYVLFRTKTGLIIRAVGDSHQSAHALGYSVIGVRYLCVMFGGACAGLAGGYLSLVYTPQWMENMTSGRGWIALALVVFASWLPWRLALAPIFSAPLRSWAFRCRHRHRHPVAAIVFAALSRDHRRAGRDIRATGLSRGPTRRLASVSPSCLTARRIHASSRLQPERSRSQQRLQEWAKTRRTDMKIWMAMAAALALSVSAGAAQAADKLKACWVYVGPVGDFGYSYQHDQGRKAVEKELGDKVETVFLENVAEGPDAERAIERLARDGCKIIFTTSFGFMDPTIKVAAKYPDVKFEHATGYKTADNVAIYNARFYEGRYVMGQIAAKMSKSGVAGYIVSFPIPEVVMGINAFMLGAQIVNPDFKVKIVWVNSWYDPGKEADAAKVLFGQGADIMVQHTDSTAPLQIAEEQGKLGFGQSSDMIKFAPKAQLTANIDNWDPYYVARVKAVLDGTWKSGSHLGRHEGWHGHARRPSPTCPTTCKAMAEDSDAKIKSGELHPFTGPITKQDGTAVGEAGKSLPDGEMLGMNYYIKGIDDQLPQ